MNHQRTFLLLWLPSCLFHLLAILLFYYYIFLFSFTYFNLKEIVDTILNWHWPWIENNHKISGKVFQEDGNIEKNASIVRKLSIQLIQNFSVNHTTKKVIIIILDQIFLPFPLKGQLVRLLVRTWCPAYKVTSGILILSTI